MNALLLGYGLLLARNLIAWDHGLVCEGYRFGRSRWKRRADWKGR